MNKSVILLLAVVASATAYGAKVDQPRLTNNSIAELEEVPNFCQGCRSLVSFVSRFNSSSARRDYKKVIGSFCEQYYPPSTDFQQGPCPMFVENFFYIVAIIDPINHCDQIGACASPATEAAELVKLPMSSVQSNNIQESQIEDGGVICTVCEQVIQQLQAQISDPDVQRKLHQQIDAFCDYLKVIREDKPCEQMLNKNLNDAINFFSHLNPPDYCGSLQLCPVHLLQQQQKKLPSLADYSCFGIETSVKKGGEVVKDVALDDFNHQKGPNCLFCKTIIKEVFKFIRDNRTEGEIGDALDKVCKVVYHEGPKFKQCEQLVATYEKELIQILCEETDPELVCMLLEQCTHHSALPKNVTVLKEQEASLFKEGDASILEEQDAYALKQASPISMSQFISLLDSSIKVDSLRTCVECKLFVKYLQDSFEDPKTQEDLKKWLLSNLCDSLGEENMKFSCVALVDQYEGDFFKAVALQLEPQTVCTDLKACRPRRNTHTRTEPPMVKPALANRASQSQVVVANKPQAATKTKSQVCETCIDIVTKIDEYLSEHSIDDDVSVLVDKVCNKMGNQSAKNECALLVRTLGADIAQAIAGMDDPRQLCTQLRAC